MFSAEFKREQIERVLRDQLRLPKPEAMPHESNRPSRLKNVNPRRTWDAALRGRPAISTSQECQHRAIDEVG
jgi:hypothetical protein